MKRFQWVFVRLSCSMELEMGVAFLFGIVSLCSGV